MIKLLIGTIFGVWFAACLFSDHEIEIGKEFTLTKDKAAALSGTDLKITMRSAGRSQNVKGGDTIYCSIDLVSRGTQSKITLDVGKSVNSAQHVVKLTKVDLTTNPKAKDPWESNSCNFIVSDIEE
jgi:hypothetical protein